MNVKEQFKEDETLDNDPLSIKEKPSQNDKAYDAVNIKEEETGDYLSDIDSIDIEDFNNE